MESSLHSVIFLGLLATILVTTNGQGEYVRRDGAKCRRNVASGGGDGV
ncbi:transmembrane protein [Arabidopsis thaliana]|uniref:Transmembrane protein n=1 Tax=Arabidopsis thaliana TaxID=3702 RepID=F4K7W9_ARATH|nr:uncharacterized protein AT5G01015 [Arabidopsis thaliana]AED90287.1 transmembrane protein [Arabidopsis thaliana]|eukprot:NP_001190198.1 transmembrane protein [Arabidopsis thaliana]